MASERVIRAQASEEELRDRRECMVAEQLVARGILDQRVLEAFRHVPRESFAPPELGEAGYEDRPLPIGYGQTVSQPYIVAVTLEALALEGHERVLDVGTGSGYGAALLSLLAREVYSIERIPELAAAAQDRLARLGYAVAVRQGDGTLGWPEHAPFDGIAVAATGPYVPSALFDQLKPGGRLVMPVATSEGQVLVRVERQENGEPRTEVLEQVLFVPLIGAQGVPEDSRQRPH